MKKIMISALLLSGAATCLAGSPLSFNTGRSDIPAVEVSAFKGAGELMARNAIPSFAAKVKDGKPVTVAFLGGSITNSGFCYRLQLASALEKRFPGSKFTWIDASLPGAGADLGAFIVDEEVVSQNPDLVFIEFSANASSAGAVEGIVRKIRTQAPSADIILLHAANEKEMRAYQNGGVPEGVVALEAVADHYAIPSVHMACEAAALEADGKLIWKGAKNDTSGKLVFSNDGLRPTKAGGSLYAAAVLRSIDAMMAMKGATTLLPSPLQTEAGWSHAKSFVPAEICRRHGLWKEVDAAGDSRMKKLAGHFPTVLTSSHPNSTISFAFDGDMFGIMDIGGPEAGQLEVYVDGRMVRLKSAKDGNLRYNTVHSLEGSHFLNRFNRNCNNRHRAQYDLIKVEPGLHQVTIKLSETKADKAKILGEKQLKDITENPEKYDKTYLMLGRILVRGELAECNPVKGLPKMAQQLKWEKKIRNYMERDAEQSAWKDATLVVGSSSIDLWKSLEEDFAAQHVIRRGVSGTKAIDLYNYRDLLIEPFDPKRIIIYEGDNEIGFKWETAEMMESMKKLFFEVRRMKPKAEIYMVSIKPSPVRAKSLPKIQEVNAEIKKFVESQPNAGYIDIHTPMLDAEGNVRPELFLKDGLHPAPEGYDIWREEFGKVIR